MFGKPIGAETSWVAIVALVLAVPGTIAVITRWLVDARKARAARLSIFVLQGDSSHFRTYNIVIRNEGPSPARLVDVHGVDMTPNTRRRILGDWDQYSSAGVELHAGEEHYVTFDAFGGIPWPVTIRTTWADGRRGTHERTRVLSVLQ